MVIKQIVLLKTVLEKTRTNIYLVCCLPYFPDISMTYSIPKTKQATALRNRLPDSNKAFTVLSQ